MLIVSQDREEIFNLNNMNSIGIVEKYAEDYAIMGTTNTYQSELGRYETIERAKEIIQEIIKNYENKVLINFKGLLSNEHEKLLLRKYNRLVRESIVLVSDEKQDIQYIPCQNNVYYMPEE